VAGSAASRECRRPRGLFVGIALGVVVLIGFTAFVLNLAENAVRREAEGRVRTTAQLGARLVTSSRCASRSSSRLRLTRARHRAATTCTPDSGRPAARAVDARRAGAPGRRRRRREPSPTRSAASSATAPRDASRCSPISPGASGIRASRAPPPLRLAHVSLGRDRQPRVTVVAEPLRAPGGSALGILIVSETHRTQAMTDQIGHQLGAD